MDTNIIGFQIPATKCTKHVNMNYNQNQNFKK
jgi:hypothetical protein